MKIVINTCFGGFSLSPRAVQRLAELQGRPCYLFTQAAPMSGKYEPAEIDGLNSRLFWYAFDIPNPSEVLGNQRNFLEMSMAERKTSNDLYTSHVLETRPENRTDPLLIQVIEELGTKAASGGCADLAIVEIPDGTEYTIEDYDGNEHVAEVHRTWR